MIEEADRRQAVEAAIALFEAFIAGEVDADEMMARAPVIWGPNEKSPPG